MSEPCFPAGRAGDERGAVVPIVALVMSTLVLFTAFAVDLGRLSMARRDLQLVADDVALDMSRRLDGSTADVLTANPAFWAAFDASRARNNFSAQGARVLRLDLGCYVQTTDTFTPAATAVAPSPSCPVPTAVKVTAGDEIDYRFHWGSAVTSRAGIAAQDNLATFSLGSLLARVNLDDAPLLDSLLGGRAGLGRPGLLGGAVNVVSYRGLASGNVSLEELRVAAGVGTIDELLTTNLTLAQYNLLAATALSAEGDTANAALFDRFRAASTHAVSFQLGDVLSVDSPTSSSGLTTEVNLFDLLVAGAQAVNANSSPPSFLTGAAVVPTVSVPGVTGVAVDFDYRVISPPVIRYNARVGATAETAQLELRTTVTFDLSLTVAGIGLTGAVRVPLTLSAAGAEALLTAIECGAAGNLIDILDDLNGATVDIDAPTGSPLVVLRTLPLGPLLPGIDAFRITADAHRDFFPGGADLLADIAVGETRTDTTGNPLDFGGVLGAANITVTALGAVSLSSAAVGSAFLAAVNPVLAAVQPAFTDLFRALGVSSPAADVTNIDTVCGGPFLAG